MKRTFSLLLLTSTLLSFSAEAQLQQIITWAGTGIAGYSGDGHYATGANLNGPLCIALDKYNNLYVSDFYNNRVRKVKVSDSSIVTFAGNGIAGCTGNGSAATAAEVDAHGVAADFRGNVYLSDPNYAVIRKVNTTGIISNYAGTGLLGYSGDNGAATSAKLNKPYGMTCDKRGNLYFADAGNSVIRKIDTLGTITTIAGTGVPGYSGDGGAATAAQLDSPYAVALDAMGNLFIADHNNDVVRMVDPTGLISTYAGIYNLIGYTGDGGIAAAATLHYPTGVAVDTAGNLFISDSYNNVIRMVEVLTTKITTVVGNGYAGFGGDLGFPTGANLFHPYDVAVDTFGSIYIADANNERIRKVLPASLLSVKEVISEVGVSAYPNPFDNTITVTGLATSDKICVIDITGKAVTEVTTAAKAGSRVIMLDNLTPGNYLLQVWDAAGVKKATVKITRK